MSQFESPPDRWGKLAWALIWSPAIMLLPFTLLLILDPMGFVENIFGDHAEALWIFFILPIAIGIALLIWRSRARRKTMKVNP